jgi:hypothetical protein
MDDISELCKSASREISTLRRWLPPAGHDGLWERIEEGGGSLGRPEERPSGRDKDKLAKANNRGGQSLLEFQHMACMRHRNHLMDRSQLVEDASETIDGMIDVGSLRFLLVILTFLLAFGVVVPLFFLGDLAPAVKGWLLWPFSLGAGLLLGYYGYELTRLAKASDLSRRNL